MILSKRLKAITEYIEEGERVIDVGCDHALLDIYLTLEKKNKCIASDINSNVLAKTKEMISSYGLEKEIEIVQSDGIDNIEIEKDDIVVIAGMGTSTILHILREKKPNNLIIQSNNDLDILRRKVIEKGYIIEDEKAVFEKGIYYVIIKFCKGNQEYLEEDYLFGPILREKKEEEMVSYFKELLLSKEKIVKQIPDNHKEKKRFINEIKMLKEILKS